MEEVTLWREALVSLSGWEVYAHDGSGWPTTTTNDWHFVYDQWNMILRWSGTGTPWKMTWGLDLSGTLHGAGGVGGLLAFDYGLGWPINAVYCFRDGNGNVTQVQTPGMSSALAHYDYSPFGELLDASGALVGIFAFGFSSKYLDSEVGLYYYGYRHDAPHLGRWLSRDPIAEQGGFPGGMRWSRLPSGSQAGPKRITCEEYKYSAFNEQGCH